MFVIETIDERTIGIKIAFSSVFKTIYIND